MTNELPTDYLRDSMRNHACTKGVSGFHHPHSQVILSIAKRGATRYNVFPDLMQCERYNMTHVAFQLKLLNCLIVSVRE